MSTQFGTALREMRLARGLTPTELSQRMGIHRVTVHSWERGRALPRIDQFFALCRALNTDPATFCIYFQENLK